MTSLERSNLSKLITQMQDTILPLQAESLSYQIAKNSSLLPEKKIMLPHYLAWYSGATKADKTDIANMLPSVCMNIIDYFGNPRKLTLREVSKIVQEIVQKVQGNNILFLYNFNQNILPYMGVETHMVSSLDEIIFSLRAGNPSLAVFKDGSEVILRGMDSNYCYVIYGNCQQEQISIKDFQSAVVALWVCSSLKKQAC